MEFQETVEHLGVTPISIRQSRRSSNINGYKWLWFRRSEAKENERKAMPAHKVGRLWRFKISEVDAWIRSNGAMPTKKESGTMSISNKTHDN